MHVSKRKRTRKLDIIGFFARPHTSVNIDMEDALSASF